MKVKPIAAVFLALNALAGCDKSADEVAAETEKNIARAEPFDVTCKDPTGAVVYKGTSKTGLTRGVATYESADFFGIVEQVDAKGVVIFQAAHGCTAVRGAARNFTP